VIYGRGGQPVTIVRVATINDVKALDNRKPDKRDREAIRCGSYVVVLDDQVERLYHLGFLEADGGSLEIGDAIRALQAPA
jgi:hypothetical protein